MDAKVHAPEAEAGEPQQASQHNGNHPVRVAHGDEASPPVVPASRHTHTRGQAGGGAAHRKNSGTHIMKNAGLVTPFTECVDGNPKSRKAVESVELAFLGTHTGGEGGRGTLSHQAVTA